ncbi:MAG: FAD-dependent oxidoreductase [Thermomicrobiales bacterium]
MSDSYDVIVVGLGAAGSATAYQLAKRGQRVLGIDMFGPGHNQGSSHGYHRLIRRSSVQNDGYVPLGERAFELWDEISEARGRQLLWMTGEIRIVDINYRPGFVSTAEKMQQGGFWRFWTRRHCAAFPRRLERRRVARRLRADGRLCAGRRGRDRAP